MEEIEIIKPNVIVAIGRRLYKELKGREIIKKFKIKRIAHCSCAFTRGKKRAGKIIFM